jgi:hypothetical protein
MPFVDHHYQFMETWVALKLLGSHVQLQKKPGGPEWS